MAPTPTSARISASSRSSQVVASILARGADRAQVAGQQAPGLAQPARGRRPARRWLGLGRLAPARAPSVAGRRRRQRGARRRATAGAASGGAGGARRSRSELDVGGSVGGHLAGRHVRLGPRPRRRSPTATPPATTTTGMATASPITTSDGGERQPRRSLVGSTDGLGLGRSDDPPGRPRSIRPGRPSAASIRATGRRRLPARTRPTPDRPPTSAVGASSTVLGEEVGSAAGSRPTSVTVLTVRGTFWLTTLEEPPGAMVTP